LVLFVWWTRRGEQRPDLEGEPTVATFGWAMEEHAEHVDGLGGLGEGLVQALATELRARGVEVGDVTADDYGWGTKVEREGAKAYVLVGAIDVDGSGA